MTEATVASASDLSMSTAKNSWALMLSLVMCFQFYLQKACVYGQRGLAQDWQASTEAFGIGRASVSGHFSLPMGTLVVEEGSASDEQEQAGRAGFSHTHTSQPLVLRVDLRVLQRKNSSCARRNFSQFLSVNFWMKPCAGRPHQRGSFSIN